MAQQSLGNEGEAILHQLLRKPPADVASWALEQARHLSEPGVRLEQLPAFKLATALSSARPEQTQALVHSALTGVNALPPAEKADAFRLAMQNASLVQSVQAAAAGRTDAAGTSGSAAASRGTHGANATNGGPSSSRQPLPSVPLVENFSRLAQEARLDRMPAADAQRLVQGAQQDTAKLMQPQQLLDVVQELRPDERQELTDKLVEAQVVPEENRAVLEDAFRPGGYADKVSQAMWALDLVRAEGYKSLALPLAEICLAAFSHLMSCGVDLPGWMNFDAVLMAGTLGGLCYALHILSPALDELRADPMGCMHRWQAARDAQHWSERLQQAVPGVELVTYQKAGIAAAAAVAAFAIGILWAVVGVLEYVATIALPCVGVIIVVFFMFLLVRLSSIVALGGGAWYIMHEYQKHMAAGGRLETSLNDPQLPMAEDALPHFGGRQDQYGHYGP